MNGYQKIENESTLSKSLESGAIVNTDKVAFENYLASRNKRDIEAKRLDNLESELSEIKALLIKLLAK
jgi:hypothetical protein